MDETIKNLANKYKSLDKEIYKYQPELTPKLDRLGDIDFNQAVINEIVLWKVNRYAQLTEKTLNLLNQISINDNVLDEVITKELLASLLSTKGIQLAMASTILRFKNKYIYQIIDQRVFRLIYKGQSLKEFNNKKIEEQIDTYLRYLKDLKLYCEQNDVKFEDSDRILYLIDKDVNKHLKLR